MEDIPKETETIASRRARRLEEKLRDEKKRRIIRVWWNNRAVEYLGLGIVLLLNIYLIFPFFGTSSGDAFYSGPIIPILSKAVEFVGRIPFPYAVQIINIIFFLIFPLSIYLFIRKVTDRKLVAVLAAVIVSLPIYPFAETRIISSLMGIDAAHVASLSIIPFALIGLLSFIRQGGIISLVIASVWSSIVALTSPFGFFTFVIFAGIITFSELLLGSGRLKIVRLISVLIISGGLIAFWYNPGFFLWMITGPLGEGIRFTISKLIPIAFFVIPPLGAFGYLLFDRKPSLQPFFIASFFTISYAIISLAGGGFFPSHPSRYVPELGISISILSGILMVKLSDFIRLNQIGYLNINKGTLANMFLVTVFLVLCTGIAIGGRKFDSSRREILGIWDEVDKGDIWEAKENFSGGHSIFGFGLTGLTVISLGVLVKNQKDK